MTRRVVSLTAGFTLTALALGMVVSGDNRAYALADDASNAKILKMAEAIKGGKKDVAAKLASDLAKEDLDESMHAFKPRSKGGLGVGRMAKVITPDGIELKLLEIEKSPAPGAAQGKELTALEEMAHVVAAIADVAAAKGPPNDKKKLKKDWDKYAGDSRDLSIQLAAAFKKGGQPVKDLATKINATCSGCHQNFK